LLAGGDASYGRSVNVTESRPRQQPKTKLMQIVRGKRSKVPRVVGYIRVYWCNSLGAWLTIPDAEEKG
jgi:hypothetical protein